MKKTGAGRRGRRLLCALLVAAMLVSLATGGAWAAFEDVPGAHWASGAIERWQSGGVMQGDGRGFRPGNGATRGEVAVVLDRIVGLGPQAENTYADLPAAAYYTAPMLRLCAAGLMRGDRGQMRPNDPVTRQEMAVLLARLAELESGGETEYSDSADVGGWARDAVGAVSNRGWFQGSGGRFRPGDPITRAELAVVLDRCVRLLVTRDTEISGSLAGFTVVNGGVLTLNGAQAQDALLIGDGGGAVLSGGHAEKIVLLGGARLTLEKGAAVDLVVVGAGASLSNVKADADAVITATELRDGALEGRVQRPAAPTVSGGGSGGGSSSGAIITREVVQSGAVLGGGQVTGHYDVVYIRPGVGDGEVWLRNLTIGKLVVEGGGAHSIVLEHTDVETAIVDKNGGEAPSLKLDAFSSLDLVAFQSDGAVVGQSGTPAVGAVVVPEGPAVALTGVAVTDIVTAGALTMTDTSAEQITIAAGTQAASVTLAGDTQVDLVVVDGAVTAQPTLNCDASTPPATLMVNAEAGAAVSGAQPPTEVYASSAAAGENISGAATVVSNRVALNLTSRPEGVTVPGNTAFQALAAVLPASLEVRCADGSTAELPVTWAPGDYDPDPLTETTYPLTGTLDPSGQPGLVVAASCRAEIAVTVEQPVRLVEITAPDLPARIEVGKEQTLYFYLTAPGLTARDITAQALTADSVRVDDVRVSGYGTDMVAVAVTVTGVAETDAARLELARIASVNEFYRLPADTLGGSFAVTDLEELVKFASMEPVLSGRTLTFRITLESAVPEGAVFAIRAQAHPMSETPSQDYAVRVLSEPSATSPYYTLSGDRTTITLHPGFLMELTEAGAYGLKLWAVPEGESQSGGIYGESGIALTNIRSERPTLDGLFRYVCLGSSYDKSNENLNFNGSTIYSVSGDTTEFYFESGWSSEIACLQYSTDRSSWTDCFPEETRNGLLAGGSAILFQYPAALKRGDTLYLRVNAPDANPYALSGGVLTVSSQPTHRITWDITGALTLNDSGTPVTDANEMERDRFTFTTGDILNPEGQGGLTQSQVKQDIYQISYTQAGTQVVRTLVDASGAADNSLNTRTNRFAPGGATVSFARIEGVDRYEVTHAVMLQETGTTALRTITDNGARGALHTVFRYEDAPGSFDLGAVTMSGTLDGEAMQVSIAGLPKGYSYSTDAAGKNKLTVSGDGSASLSVKLPAQSSGGGLAERNIYAEASAASTRDTIHYTGRNLAFTIRCGKTAPAGGETPSYKIARLSESFYDDPSYRSLTLILDQELPEGTTLALQRENGEAYQLPDGAQAVELNPYSPNQIAASGLLTATDVSSANPVVLVLTPPAGAAIREESTYTLYAQTLPSRLWYYGPAQVPEIDETVAPTYDPETGETTITLKAPENLDMQKQTAGVLYLPNHSYQNWDLPVVDNTLTIKENSTTGVAAKCQLVPGSQVAFLGQSDGAPYRISPSSSTLKVYGYKYDGGTVNTVENDKLGVRVNQDGTVSTLISGYFTLQGYGDTLEVKTPTSPGFVPVTTEPSQDSPFTRGEVAYSKLQVNFTDLAVPGEAADYIFRCPGSYKTTQNNDGTTTYTVKGGSEDYVTLDPFPAPVVSGVSTEDHSGSPIAALSWEKVSNETYYPAVLNQNSARYYDNGNKDATSIKAWSRTQGGYPQIVVDTRVPNAFNVVLLPLSYYGQETFIPANHTIQTPSAPCSVATQPGGSKVADIDVALFGEGQLQPSTSNRILSIASSDLTSGATVDAYLGDSGTPTWTNLTPQYSETWKRTYVDLEKENGFLPNDQVHLVARTGEANFDRNALVYTFAGDTAQTPRPTPDQILKVLAYDDEKLTTPISAARRTVDGVDGILFTTDSDAYRSVTCSIGEQTFPAQTRGNFFLSMDDITPEKQGGTTAIHFTYSNLPYRGGGGQEGIYLNEAIQAGTPKRLVTYEATSEQPMISSITVAAPEAGVTAPGERAQITMAHTGGDYAYTLYAEDGRAIANAEDGVITFNPARAMPRDQETSQLRVQCRYGAINNEARTISLGGQVGVELRTRLDGSIAFPITGILTQKGDPRAVEQLQFGVSMEQKAGCTGYWGRPGEAYTEVTAQAATVTVPYPAQSGGYETRLVQAPAALSGDAGSGTAAWAVYVPLVKALAPYFVESGSANEIKTIAMHSENDKLMYTVMLDRHDRIPIGVFLEGEVYETSYEANGGYTSVQIPYGTLTTLQGLVSLPSVSGSGGALYTACPIGTALLQAFQPATVQEVTLDGNLLTVTLDSADSYTGVITNVRPHAYLQIGAQIFPARTDEGDIPLYTRFVFDISALEGGLEALSTATLWRSPAVFSQEVLVEDGDGLLVDLTGLNPQPAPAQDLTNEMPIPDEEQIPPDEGQTPPDEGQTTHEVGRLPPGGDQEKSTEGEG